MTDNSSKTKRRAPGEKTTDGKQDADWGFDAAETDPSIEKKLGLVLVVCLLAGFGFVFFQKYRLLQTDTAQAQADSPAATETEAQDILLGKEETLQQQDAPQSVEHVATTARPVDESPFDETPPAPAAAPTPAQATDWMLAQAEVPQSTAPQAEFVPTDAATDPATQPDTFDPFAVTDVDSGPQPETAQPPAAESTESRSQSLTWDDPLPAQADEPASAPAPPPQSEPDPFFDAEPQASAASESPLEISPFGDEAPAVSVPSPEPSPTLDAMPPSEPQPPAESEPQLTFLDDSPTPDESPAPEQDFDPFQSPEPAAEPTEQNPVAPGPAVDPFADASPPLGEQPIPAEPAADEQPQPSLTAQPEQKTIVEPPAWPFPQTTDDVATDDDPSWPSETPAPAQAEAEPVHQWPSTDSPAATASAPETPPSPFEFDATASRPIAESFSQPQAAIGVREIAVTPSDTFWSISQREYGSARYFTALARFNSDRVAAPEKLRAGMKIRIPPPEVLEDSFPELFGTAAQRMEISPISGFSVSDASDQPGLFLDQQQQPRYRVGKRDTLSSIAQSALGRSSRWTEIYELNRDQLKSPSTLKIGMVLKLPPEAAPVDVSPAGGLFR